MVRRAAVLLALLAVLLPSGPAHADSLAVEVNRAIEKGVAHLRTLQNEDGSFRGDRSDTFPDGVAGLALYALLRSGVPPDDPAVKKAVEWLQYRKVDKTYSAAVRILALDALGDGKRKEPILAMAKWLEDSLHPRDHLWSYAPGDDRTDLSNTQFAVIGLVAAEKHGFRAKPETWESLLLPIPALQTAEGGFFYSTNREARIATATMSEAGILVLEIALARVDARKAAIAPLVRRAKESLARAWAYHEKRFTATTGFEGAHAFRNTWLYYYFWGMERLGAVTGRREFGGHDWYQEGARTLVARQGGDGSWGNGYDTCFSLLFLRRATFTLLDREAPPLPEGAETAPPPPPALPRPAEETPFVRRWLLLGPLPNPGDNLMEEPPFKAADARPRAGSDAAGRKWAAYRSPSDWVDLKKAVGAGDNTITWAFTWLHVAEDQEAVLWVGHDDAFAVHLDGEKIHHFHFHEGAAPDEIGLRVALKKGVHRVLVAIEEGWGGTGLCLRIARPDGGPAPGVVPSLSAARTEVEETALAQPGFFTLEELLRFLPLETKLTQGYVDEGSLLSVAAVSPEFAGHWPRWLEGPSKKGERGPAEEFQGAVGLHPTGSRKSPARILRKVRVPMGRTAFRVRAAGESRHSGGRADVVVRLGVFSGEIQWLREDLVGGVTDASKERWKVLEAELDPWAGKEVLLVVEVAQGGRAIEWEEAWFDEISVVHR